MTINLTDPANQLTAEQLVTLQLRIMSALSFYRQRPEKEARRMAELLELAGAAASELQECRKAAAEPAVHDEHVRREVNVGGNTWVQCSKHAYDKAKAEGKIVRELYERSQPGQVEPELMPQQEKTTCMKCGRTTTHPKGWHYCHGGKNGQ